jgi:hypothetical protein
VALARALAVLGGGADAATGLLLLAAPARVLALLGAPQPAASPLATAMLPWRWVGVFVGAVGLAYLYPLLPRWRNAARLRGVLEVTALLRAAVALFVTATLLASALPPGWWLVAATDAALAASQVALLRRGEWE